MPWKECRTVFELRKDFVEKKLSGLYGVSELCRLFKISRQTGYKWLRRFEAEGYLGLRDRRRTPESSPRRVAVELVRAILELRDEQPTWGARKLRTVLLREQPERAWPSKSAFHKILVREGRVRQKTKRRRHAHPGKPIVDMGEPNVVWTADYKGQFRLGNGKLCYPLTVADGCSRFLLECRSLTSTKQEPSAQGIGGGLLVPPVPPVPPVPGVPPVPPTWTLAAKRGVGSRLTRRFSPGEE